MTDSKNKLECYAIAIDGRTSELYVGREAAIRGLQANLDDHPDGTVELRKLRSLYDLIREYADFEDPDDDEWMQQVLEHTLSMIYAEENKQTDEAKRHKDLLERAAEGRSGMTLDEIAEAALAEEEHYDE